MKLYYDKPESLSAAISGERRGIVNREILFRGKRNDTGEWIYGDLRQDKDLETAYIGGWEYYTADFALQREPFEYSVDPETVGQYTGLTDKNGVKIFEGDIIAGKIGKFVIRWSELICGFAAGEGFKMVPCMNQGTMQNYEVIGNIHDNPEMLEVSGNNG